MFRGFVATFVVLCGCPIDEETVPSGVTGETGTAEPPAELATVSGSVGRTAPLAVDGDGVGTLFVAAFDVCELTGTVLGVAVTPSADLSADGAEVPFTIADLPRAPV